MDDGIPLHGVSLRHLKSITSSYSKEIKVREIVEQRFKEITKVQQCSYAELLIQAKSEMVKEKAELFVSYCWDYPWRVLMDALTPEEDDEDCFIWLDCVVLNQHYENVGNPQWWFDAFQSALRKIGKVAVVIHPWFSPEYFTRSWCLFEALQASISEIPVSLRMSKLDRSVLKQFMRNGQTDLLFFQNIFSKVNLEMAKACKIEDERKILSMLREFGIDQVSQALMVPFKNWFLLIEQEIEWEFKQDLYHHRSSQGINSLIACAELKEYFNESNLETLLLFENQILPFAVTNINENGDDYKGINLEAIWYKYEQFCKRSDFKVNLTWKNKVLKKINKMKKKSTKQKTAIQAGYEEPNVEKEEEKARIIADQSLLLDFLLSVPELHELSGSEFDIMLATNQDLFYPQDENIIIEEIDFKLNCYVIRSGIVQILEGGLILDELRSGEILSNNVKQQIRKTKGFVHICKLPRLNMIHLIGATPNSQKQDDDCGEKKTVYNSLFSHATEYAHALRNDMDARTQLESKIAKAKLATLYSYSPELSSMERLERVLKCMYDIFEVERISLFYVDWNTNELILQTKSYNSDLAISEIRFPVTVGISGACAMSGKVINVPDAYSDPRFFKDMDIKANFRTRSILCYPIFSENDKERPVSVLMLVNKKKSFSNDKEQIFNEEHEVVIAGTTNIITPMICEGRDDCLKLQESEKYIPLFQVEENFSVEIQKIETSSFDSFILKVQLFHGDEPISNQMIRPLQTCRLEFDIVYQNLPRAGKMVFEICSSTLFLKKEIPLFDFSQILQSSRTISFGGNIGKIVIGTKPSSTNKEVIWKVDIAATYAPKIQESPSHIVRSFIERLNEFISKNPLHQLTVEDKLLLSQSRPFLRDQPLALAFVLKSIKWDSSKDVLECMALLYHWSSPTPYQALTLLDQKIPDPRIRALAVSIFEGFSDKELIMFLLQLVQAMRTEPYLDCALSRFLIRRALRSPQTVGRALFWELNQNNYNNDDDEKDQYFQLLKKIYYRNCGEMYREKLGQEEYVVKKIHLLNRQVALSNNPTSLQILLQQIRFPSKFQLPIRPEKKLLGISLKNTRLLKNKAHPLYIQFISSDPLSPSLTVLSKENRDLRTDQFVLRFLQIIDFIWKEKEGLDLNLTIYDCFPTGGAFQGIIEIIMEAKSFREINFQGTSNRIFSRIQAMANVYDIRRLKRWLEFHDKAYQDRFLKSCAGYLVATYVLGIGNRHMDKIMLTKSGTMFHIDYSQIFNQESKIYLTPSMLYILGGINSPKANDLKALCIRAFHVLRRNSYFLISLFILSLPCGLSKLKTEENISFFIERLMLDKSNQQAEQVFVRNIIEGYARKSTQLRDTLMTLEERG